MGFIKNLFGGGKGKPPERKPIGPVPSRRQPTRDKPATTTPAAPAADAAAPARPAAAAVPPPSVPSPSTGGDLSDMPSKQLQRLLGATDAATRTAAAAILAERREVTSVRPLITAYLNSADPQVLDAMKAFGRSLTAPATHDAADPGIIGERRARLIDILGMTGDAEAAAAVRPNVDDRDPVVHARACMALARLGDLHGVDELSHDMERSEVETRTLALDSLRQLDLPQAREAVDDHVSRYLSSAGAVPAAIDISAPRLENPDMMLSTYAAEHIKASPHSLTVVVGPGATRMATARRAEIEDVLKGFDLHFTTESHPPEEQISILEAARDAAAENPDVRAVVFGRLPSPTDRPPLPHFLRKLGGPGYTAKIMIVEPHEVNQVVGWWRYVDETRRVPTDFEVVLGISRPENSPITQEEYLIYTLTPEEKRRDFLRAFVANL